MKNRLIKLLNKGNDTFMNGEGECSDLLEHLAEYLLSNGVIALPAKVGDTVYCDICNVGDGNYIDECVIKFIEFDFDWDEPLFTAICREKGTYQTYWACNFGHSIFKEPKFAKKKGKKK